eukprot:tig00021254_g19714.t1
MPAGCAHAAARPVPEVLRIAARARGRDPDALDLSSDAVLRYLYTGEGSASSGMIDNGELGGGTGSAGGGALLNATSAPPVLADEPLVTPPPAYDALSFYATEGGTDGTCFGTSGGTGSCAGSDASPALASSLGGTYTPIDVESAHCCCPQVRLRRSSPRPIPP